MPDPTRIRAHAQGGSVEVRVLMTHEMETGQRRDGSGNIVPPHFITTVAVTHAGRVVLGAEWGPAVSKHPFLQFRFTGGKAGDEITVSWADSKGETRTDRVLVG